MSLWLDGVSRSYPPLAGDITADVAVVGAGIAGIATAYFVIPLALVNFVRKRRDLPFNWMFVCFGIFILACGMTHVMEIITLWKPYYWVSGIVKAITALLKIAVMTVVACIFAPIVLAYQGWSYHVFRRRLAAPRAVVETPGRG